MKIFMNLFRLFVVITTFIFAGCATSPWHANLLDNNQLLAADCQQLAMEQRRVADNIRHTKEASGFGTFGAVLLGVMEGLAGSSGKSAENTASLANEHARQASELEKRENLLNLLRGKKGCV